MELFKIVRFREFGKRNLRSLTKKVKISLSQEGSEA